LKFVSTVAGWIGPGTTSGSLGFVSVSFGGSSSVTGMTTSGVTQGSTSCTANQCFVQFGTYNIAAGDTVIVTQLIGSGSPAANTYPFQAIDDAGGANTLLGSASVAVSAATATPSPTPSLTATPTPSPTITP